MFGIRLPVNFDSPYKAASIIEFWRRWHITLSRFLRDYLYIPLGGNSHGSWRRCLNLMLTTLLGGLWHGAGWTYVMWGALHGIYLMINHGWRAFRKRLSGTQDTIRPLELFLGRGLTFLAVVLGWVFFRAADIGTAFTLLRAMAGANGLSVAASPNGGAAAMLVVAALLLIAWLAPNSQELVGYQGPNVSAIGQRAMELRKVAWQPTMRWAVLIGGLAGISIMSLSRVSEFLYFQF